MLARVVRTRQVFSPPRSLGEALETASAHRRRAPSSATDSRAEIRVSAMWADRWNRLLLDFSEKWRRMRIGAVGSDAATHHIAGDLVQSAIVQLWLSGSPPAVAVVMDEAGVVPMLRAIGCRVVSNLDHAHPSRAWTEVGMVLALGAGPRTGCVNLWGPGERLARVALAGHVADDIPIVGSAPPMGSRADLVRAVDPLVLHHVLEAPGVWMWVAGADPAGRNRMSG